MADSITAYVVNSITGAAQQVPNHTDFSGWFPCIPGELVSGVPQNLSGIFWNGPALPGFVWTTMDGQKYYMGYRGPGCWAQWKWANFGFYQGWGIGLFGKCTELTELPEDGGYSTESFKWPTSVPPSQETFDYRPTLLESYLTREDGSKWNEPGDNNTIYPIYSEPDIKSDEVLKGCIMTVTLRLLNAGDFGVTNACSPSELPPLTIEETVVGTYEPKIYAYIDGHVPPQPGVKYPNYTPIPKGDPIWGGLDPKEKGYAVGGVTITMPGDQPDITARFTTGGSGGKAIQTGVTSVNISLIRGNNKSDTGTERAMGRGIYTEDGKSRLDYRTGISIPDLYGLNTKLGKEEVILHTDGSGLGSNGCISVSPSDNDGGLAFWQALETLNQMFKDCGRFGVWGEEMNVPLEVAVSEPGVEYYAGPTGTGPKQNTWGHGGEMVNFPEGQPGNPKYHLSENWEPYQPEYIPPRPDIFTNPVQGPYVPPGTQIPDAFTNWNVLTEDQIGVWTGGTFNIENKLDHIQSPLGSIVAFGGNPGDLPPPGFNQDGNWTGEYPKSWKEDILEVYQNYNGLELQINNSITRDPAPLD